MKIGLDFDCVISDAGKLKSEGAKRIYGVDIPPEKFKTEIVPHRFLFSQGYNLQVKVDSSIAKRINSWQSFYEEISKINVQFISQQHSP